MPFECGLSGGDWNELSKWVSDSVRRSDEVRQALGKLSSWLVATLQEAELANRPVEEPVQRAPEPVAPRPLVEIGSAIEQLRSAWSRSQMPTEAQVETRPAKVAPPPPPSQPREMAPRARLKAEACRWAVQRRELESGSASDALSTQARNDDLRKRARACGSGDLWMLSRDVDLPDSASMHMLAAGFDNLGHALELALELDAEQRDDRETMGAVLTSIAECQSAVRALIKAHGLPEDDEQNDAYRWLSERTRTLQHYLPRFMSLDAPADPTQWEDLAARLASFQARLSAERARRRNEREARGRVSYHVKRILNSFDGGHTSELALDDWRRLFSALDGLLALGVKTSDVRLREELLPLVEARPLEIEVPECWDRIVDEIDRAIALKELDESAKSSRAPRERTPAVLRVAELLQGKRVVMVGGANRPLSRQALIDAFELADLDWITSREHSSNEVFRASIAREETVLVLLLIRWSSHSYGALKQMAEGYGKKFVNLPRGYNPTQVAEEILRQVSLESEPS